MSATQETKTETPPSGKSFSYYPPSENKFIEQMKKSASKYKQNVERYQEDWTETFQNYFKLVESLQHDYAEKSDTTISMIDANTRIVRSLNENAKALAELHQTIAQTWFFPWSSSDD